MIKTVIVDDEQWTRDVIKAFGSWELYGMEIVGEADDGSDAIRLIERCEPHVVITDMRMPGADGIELLGFLNDRYPQIKVIVVSGYDDFVYTRQAIRCKAGEYLLKPIDPQELNAALLKCKTELDSSLHERRQQFSFNMDVIQIIHTYKPILCAYYNELNSEGIRNSLKELLNQVETAEPIVWERLFQEFVLVLKELEVSNSLEPNDLPLPVDTDSFSSCHKLRDRLEYHYLLSLEQLVEQRKYKNRLNLAEVKQFIDRNYSEPITVEKIAKAFYVSKEYLSKAFKGEFGLNLTDYIQNLRMEKAKELLLKDQIPIKAIAEISGYEELGYFYRVFKKHYGVAPGEMRKSTKPV